MGSGEPPAKVTARGPSSLNGPRANLNLKALQPSSSILHVMSAFNPTSLRIKTAVPKDRANIRSSLRSGKNVGMITPEIF